MHNTDYRIGLALSKSLFELHKGELTVESELATSHNNGHTSFTVYEIAYAVGYNGGKYFSQAFKKNLV